MEWEEREVQMQRTSRNRISRALITTGIEPRNTEEEESMPLTKMKLRVYTKTSFF